VRPDDRGPGLVGVVEYSTADEMREALRSLDGARIRGEQPSPDLKRRPTDDTMTASVCPPVSTGDRVRLDPEGPHNPFNLRTGYRGGGGGGGDRARSRSRDRGAPPPRSSSDRDYEGRGGRDDDRSGGRGPRDDGDRDYDRGCSSRGGRDDDAGRSAAAAAVAPEAAAAAVPE
jgi:hypothetical protein